MKLPIQVWAWEDCPADIKHHCPIVDDVDWVAIVPADVEIPEWMYGPMFDTCQDPCIGDIWGSDAKIVVGTHA